MSKLKIATLHCFGSNPTKHATQRYHFVHCAEATRDLADWVYPTAPHTLDRESVYGLLRMDMGCSEEETQAFGFEDPRCWFRYTDGRYDGLETTMEYLADFCRRERPDGIAGYSNGGGAALLCAAACEGGQEAFQSIRFAMSFCGATSPMMQKQMRAVLGPDKQRLTMPAIIFGSRRDPMLVNADAMAGDLFEKCTLAVVDEARPFANHALPDDAASYAPIVAFLQAQKR